VFTHRTPALAPEVLPTGLHGASHMAGRRRTNPSTESMTVHNRSIKFFKKSGILSAVCLAALFSARIGYCVPAIPAPHQIEQPDGYKFTARLWGDEKTHGWETLDGYTITKDPSNSYWTYVTKQTGAIRLQSAGVVGAAGATAGISKHLRPAKKVNPRAYGGSNDSIRKDGVISPSRSIQRASATGTRKIPVILVNFSDTATTFDSAQFQSLLFGSGTKSMKDYYEEVSYGAFSVAPGTSGVTGWYTAAGTHAYYGDNDADGYDRHPGELVIEAVAAADPDVDFAEYDTDGDCYVDAVVIVHQGSGEEAGGPADDIWSHQWDLASAAYFGDGTGVYTTHDHAACGDIKIRDYVIQPETLDGGIQTVGVFAHEYGHVLGLPDLYDIDYSSSGIGYWGLMSTGAWGSAERPGDSPVHPCAWSKYMLGWVTPVPVSTRLSDVTIDPASVYADVYQFFPGNQTTSPEYYLIENRQRIGFDAALPGAGLAIWHIDESMASTQNLDNARECTSSWDCSNAHYRVALVQADGNRDLEFGDNDGDSGDLYPGTSGNTAFNYDSIPSSSLYNASSSNVDISGITQSGNAIIASLGLTFSLAPTATGGGFLTPGVATTIDYGDELTFAIIPNAGFRVSNVLIDGVPMGAISEYTFSETRFDHTINAVFATTSSEASSSGGGSSGGCFIASSL
jgi:immune inhibitor A